MINAESLVPVWPRRDLPVKIVRGMAAQLVSHLVDKSNQHQIMDRNPKDHLERFASHESFEAWHRSLDQPALYWLISLPEDRQPDLAGFLWTESRQPVNNNSPAYHIAKPRIFEGHEYLGRFCQALISECAHDYKIMLGQPYAGYTLIPDDIERWRPYPVGPEANMQSENR